MCVCVCWGGGGEGELLDACRLTVTHRRMFFFGPSLPLNTCQSQNRSLSSRVPHHCCISFQSIPCPPPKCSVLIVQLP